MTCSLHPTIDSVAFCGQCGRALCPECKREVGGMIYCESCLDARLRSTLPPIIGPSSGPSPGLALLLSIIPGVGAVYNGQVAKGLLIQLPVIIALIAIADHIDVAGLAVAAFWIYTGIDSYQTARRKQLGQPVEEWLGLGEFKMNAPLGAAVFIGMGVLILLNNLGMHVFESVYKFWPVLLIVIGLVLLQRRVGRSAPPPPSSGLPSPPKGGGPSNIPGPQGM